MINKFKQEYNMQNQQPKKRITAEERKAINKALFDSIFRKGLKGVDKALKSGKVPLETVDKDGTKKPVDKEKVSTFIEGLLKRQETFRKNFDELRKEGIRRHREAFGPHFHHNFHHKHKAKEESKADDVKAEVKVEETKVEQAGDKK